MIEDAEAHHGSEPPDQLVINNRYRQLSGLYRCFQVISVKVLSRRHLQVKPGLCRGDSTVDGAKVGCYKAVKSPLFLKYVIQQKVILAAIGAIYPWVRTHQRGSVALPDRHLESGKIDFAHHALINLFIH